MLQKCKKDIRKIFDQFFKEYGLSFFDDEWIFGYRLGEGAPRVEFIESSYYDNTIDILINKNIEELNYLIDVEVDAIERYAKDSLGFIKYGTFSRFIGKREVQIEYKTFGNQREKDYCNSETLYLIDNKSALKEEFTEGMDIIIEETSYDFCLKSVRGFKNLKYREEEYKTAFSPTFEEYEEIQKTMMTSIYYKDKERFQQELEVLKALFENIFSTWIDNPKFRENSISRLDLLPISIRGRVAYGIVCLEKFCEAYNVASNNMKELIEALWFFTDTKAEWLEDWKDMICKKIGFMEEVYEYAYKYEYRNLPFGIQEDITNLIDEVLCIATVNYFGRRLRFNSRLTEEPTLKVAEILIKNNIELPDINVFKISNVEEGNGWGNEIDPEEFKKRLNYY